VCPPVELLLAPCPRLPLEVLPPLPLPLWLSTPLREPEPECEPAA
jgi:hypothetical protein